MGFFTVPRITWGPGALEQLSALEAHRVAVVVDPRVEKLVRFARVVEELGKTGASVYVTPEVVVEPTVASVESVAEAFRARNPDSVVAVGGGSTMDTARAAWVRWVRPELDLRRVSPLVELGLRARARMVAVPTTSGSGAEASWQVHLWDADGSLVELASRELQPDWAVLDPVFSESLDRPTTADGAADTLAHAVEAIESEWAHPFSDAVAFEALSIAAHALPRLARHPDEEGVRASTQYASTLAGLAMSNASTGNVHALAHALHASTGLRHGRLVGILLPYLVDFNFPSARDALLRVSAVLGPAGPPQRGTVAGRLRELLAPFAIPESLVAAGVDGEAVLRDGDTIVERAMRSTSALANPRIASRTEWQDLLRRVTLGPMNAPLRPPGGAPTL